MLRLVPLPQHVYESPQASGPIADASPSVLQGMEPQTFAGRTLCVRTTPFAAKRARSRPQLLYMRLACVHVDAHRGQTLLSLPLHLASAQVKYRLAAKIRDAVQLGAHATEVTEALGPRQALKAG